jgi:hypothetical protein
MRHVALLMPSVTAHAGPTQLCCVPKAQDSSTSMAGASSPHLAEKAGPVLAHWALRSSQDARLGLAAMHRHVKATLAATSQDAAAYSAFAATGRMLHR